MTSLAYLQHEPVELGRGGVVGLVQDDHPGAAEGEHEAARQALQEEIL